MVTKEEIEHVSKLMRIEIDNHTEYIDKVQKIIDYFDILDEAGVESEELNIKEISINELREDKYILYDDKLIEKLKNYKGSYVRAPKMS